MKPERKTKAWRLAIVLWLLANCAAIVFWPESPMMWFPFVVVPLLLWPIVGVYLLIVSIARPRRWRHRLASCAFVLVGAGVGWQSPSLGPIVHVWLREDDYLERVRAALAHPPPARTTGPGWVIVDHSDWPPVRVAFFWFAVRGTVDGVVYDPTGEVVNGSKDWMHATRVTHLFGPWYRFR